ncbi:ABC transporter ATP-binding protein, partial [Frankia sp. Cpl3]|nr:ABC transporter ATP-binding protein [Frankia sp. Cpl3]
AGAYNIPVAKRKSLIADLLELVNLSNKADAYVDSLSRGMKQRLGLARCLVHSPEVLILDEPASGLDPRARIEMREILKQLRQMGKTILISSHILPELAELCDEIGVIEQGKMIACGSVDEVSAGARGISIMELRPLNN